MNVVVAGRVSVGPDIVFDVFDGCVVVVVCWPLELLDPVDDEVDVDCAAALVATASSNAAAITTRFSIRTSASQTDTHTGSYSGWRKSLRAICAPAATRWRS